MTTMFKLKYKNEEYEIHTEEEAIKLNLRYEYWKDAGIDAEYLLGDDDHVIPVLSATRWQRGLLVFETPFGRITKYKKIVRNPQSTKERWNGFWKGDNEPIGILTDKKKLFVEWYIRNGGDSVQAYRNTHLGCSEKNIKKMAKRLLAQKEVRTYMTKQLGDLLDGLGITDEWIVKRYKDLVTTPLTSDGAKKAALDKLAEFRGLNEREQRTTAQFVLMGDDEIKALNDAKQKALKAGDTNESDTSQAD